MHGEAGQKIGASICIAPKKTSIAWGIAIGFLMTVICVCVGHAGDYFHDYVAIRKSDDGMWRKVGRFGAYWFGEKVADLDERSFYLVQAGEPIKFALD